MREKAKQIKYNAAENDKTKDVCSTGEGEANHDKVNKDAYDNDDDNDDDAMGDDDNEDDVIVIVMVMMLRRRKMMKS